MIRSIRSVFAFLSLGLSCAWDAIGFALYALNPLNFPVWAEVSCWVAALKARTQLKVSALVCQDFRGWSAHALNDRRVGGAACHGDLLGPACRALVG